MQILREINDDIKLNSSTVVEKYLEEFKGEDREHVIVIGVDSKNKPLYRDIVSIGILNASLIHAREVFRRAISMSANSIFLAHNHPSGDTTPSNDDDEVTQRIKKAGDILGVKLIDHLILGDTTYSYKNEGKI